MAAPHQPYDVFLSHAGEQKRPIVDAMHTLLGQVPGVSVFMDEHSLVPGDDGWATIVDAAHGARVAVVVLTREFAAKWAPMEELRIFLQRHADPKDKLVIVPVLPEDTWECFNQVDKVYKENDLPGGGWPQVKRPDDSMQKEWAAWIKKLVALTCVRGDQEGYYQGKLASRAVDVVVRRLVELDRLPAGFTWETRVNWEWVHLPARCLDLVGRDEEVEQVVAALEGRQKAAVLEGAAGIGKSTIAVEAAWELCVRGRCTGGAFEIDFAGFGKGESPKAWLASSLYTQLNLCTGLHPPKDGTWDSIVAWLKTCARGSVLLLLENFEDAATQMSDDGSDPLTKELLEMFRQLANISGRHGPTVLLLLGSRYYNYPLIKSAEKVQVGALPLEAAEKVLTYTASGVSIEWEDGLAEQLARLLECHPLTLQIIAGFIGVGRCTPQGVVNSMAEAGRVTGAVPTGSRRPGVRPLLEKGRISEQWLLEILREDELRVLAAVSVFRGSFPMQGALVVDARGTEEHVEDMQDLLEGLVALNLLRLNVASEVLGQRYSMHLLIRELVVEMSARAANVQMLWLSWMAEHERGPGQLLLRHAATGPDPNLVIVREVVLHEQLNFREVAHSLDGVTCHEGHDALLMQLGIVGAALRQGDLVGARQLQEAVVRNQQQLLGDDHPDTLGSMNNLAVTMQQQGDLAGARQLMEDVLQKCQQVLGDENPNTLTIMGNIAVIMQQQGHLVGARQLQDAVLQKRQHLLGDNHQDTLTSMANLAITMRQQGDLAGVRQLQEAVLQKLQQLLGNDHPDTLTSMAHLALTRCQQGDLAGARQLQEAVLQKRQQVLGDDHQDTLTSMANLAITMRQQHELAGARRMEQAVMQKMQLLLGNDHPYTLISMANLAVTLHQQGDMAGARQLGETVTQKLQQLLGDDHPDTITSMANLAITMRQQGNLAAARQLQEAVLQKQRQLLGEDHPDMLIIMDNLAIILHLQGDLAGARQLGENVLQKRQVLLGDDHPDMLASMNNLASTMARQGDLTGARQLQEAMLHKRQRVLGDDHPDTLMSMANLAKIDEEIQRRRS